MIFKKDIVKRVLKQSKKKRIKELSYDLDNIVFLDFDGVINLDIDNYTGPFNDRELIDNLNSFCLSNNFKIVVISSWRKYSNYKDILYSSGLDRKISILGATENLEKDRSSEVLKYLEDNHYIDKFVILDDKPLIYFENYQIQTDYNKGFTNEELNRANILIKEMFK